MRRTVAFLHELGTIMYVGGILSHIVIGAIFTDPSPETEVTVYTYKLQSAYRPRITKAEGAEARTSPA